MLKLAAILAALVLTLAPTPLRACNHDDAAPAPAPTLSDDGAAAAATKASAPPESACAQKAQHRHCCGQAVCRCDDAPAGCEKAEGSAGAVECSCGCAGHLPDQAPVAPASAPRMNDGKLIVQCVGLLSEPAPRVQHNLFSRNLSRTSYGGAPQLFLLNLSIRT